MAMAQKYKVGMYLGPDNIYFKEELPKKETGRSKRLIRQGIFICQTIILVSSMMVFNIIKLQDGMTKTTLMKYYTVIP